jgi:hypothetical protein
MGNVRLTLGIAAYLTTLATGCASSGHVGEVKEVGQGTYSIGVPTSTLQANEALNATVDKAGAYCHSKGQKLLVTDAAGKTINFRCVPGDSNPQ